MTREIDEALVRRMAQLLEETGLTEIEYAAKDWSLRVAKAPAPVAHVAPAAIIANPVPSVASLSQPEELGSDHPGALLSPMVGTVYASAEPGSAPFVKEGDKVRQGQTVLIVEAMKVMNPIPAPRAGTIQRIAVGNGQPVEFGELLMVID
ncbi:MAG: acetyl-CoA carboxylase biotin carboxyl carrier protein [Proteobacteria bacterium]|nr:acetyl-CoA carboxylase biotin carboxyl carrier protein [Pseudomonadota bacterium]MBI3497972.1 acetyl-CoA carboxylase biotin carboxyl carrier protein [Pseudomonadota bacterium]